MRIKLIAGATVITLAVVLLSTSAASAHVSVNPKSADQGSYAKLTFRVPNESPDATTTKVEVNIPDGTPLASVSVQPQAGWAYSVTKTTLKTPIKTDDGSITESVSKITWTADADHAIKAGEFNEFNISAGPLPTNATSIAFKALQTYSNGDIVRWIDTPATGQEAEHPAPTLTLTPAGTTSTKTSTSTPTVKQSEVDSTRNMSIIALIVAIIALFVAVAILIAFITKRRH